MINVRNYIAPVTGAIMAAGLMVYQHITQNMPTYAAAAFTALANYTAGNFTGNATNHTYSMNATSNFTFPNMTMGNFTGNVTGF